MPGILVMELEAARQRVASLECSLRVYRDFPGAAEKVAEQLDAAYEALARLEARR